MLHVADPVPWQHSPVHLEREHNSDWDLSELFRNAMDPRAMPSSEFAHPPHQPSHHTASASHHHVQQPPQPNQSQHQGSRYDYDQQQSQSQQPPAQPAHRPPFHSSNSHPQSYDHQHQQQHYELFNSPPQTSSFGTAPPSRYAGAPASNGDMFYQNGSSSSFSNPPSSGFELLGSLGSVPEDSVVADRQPSPRNNNYSPYHSPNTVSPNAISSGERFASENTFGEMIIGRASPNNIYSPNHPVHPPRPSTAPHEHMSYPYGSDPSTSAGVSPLSRQYDGPNGYGSAPYDQHAAFEHNGSSVKLSQHSPHLDQYLRSSNRLAAGEQTVIVMSSRVAQKSYGNEKRFLCPPPTAVLLGHSWWSDASGSDTLKPSNTQVVISISGEPVPSDGTLEWSTPSGKPIDYNEDYVDNSARVGRCVGKQLFISDVDERKKRVEALVKIGVTAQAPDGGVQDYPIGTFPSRPIKVISKPSKKRQSAKNLELCINHGSTVSLFHRLRSQTVSTKYLCVSGSGASFKGSDGAPLPGLDPRQRTSAPSFVAKTASWDMFIIYIVDVNKPSSGPEAIAPSPVNPEYPPPPPNAISPPADQSATPIFYNQTVVLQCLTSGVVSPVLIIRKVDHATVVVGGGMTENAKGVPDYHCLPGEVCGDPVSQLHKIAFEVYEPGLGANEALGGPGLSGAYLSCMGEKVNTYRPVDVRQWNNGGNPSSPSSLTNSPLPTNSNMASKGASPDPPFFPGAMGQSTPPTNLPQSFDFETTTDGGRVRRKRGMSGSGGKVTAKGRRRVNSVSSGGSSRTSPNDASIVSGALWSIDIGETAVWTIVGTDQVRYNFFIPPTIHNSRPLHIPSNPVSDIVAAHKYVDGSGVISLHGEGFIKNDPPAVFFGTEQSTQVEVRSNEVLVCRPPPSVSSHPGGPRRPIILVRSDGVVYPTNVMFP